MANRKISELPSAGALTGAELVEAVQDGVNVQTTTQDIADLGGGGPGGSGDVVGPAVATDSVPVLFNGTTGKLVKNSTPTGTGAPVLADSPALTGTPTAPTAATTTNTTQVASTAFVQQEIAAKTVGTQDLFIPASAMWPRATSGCSELTRSEIATSLFNIQTLDFNQTTQEFAQLQLVLPRKWNNGTITAMVYWTAASGSGTVQWGISGVAYTNDDALTVAFGTPQTADDTLITTNDLHISPETSAITIAGTPADADFLALQISRNPASDTLSADAKLLGVSIRITTDSAKDA